MPHAEPSDRKYDTFEIETEVGKRRLEFDPDVILGRDVRVLVDRARVAAVPLPKPAAPFHEVAFELDGHPLVGVAWLPPESDAQGFPLGYDVFADGQSLSGRQPLAEVRVARSTPRKRYPTSFSVLDNVVRIAPAASAPGLVGGLGRSGELGWPRTIVLLTTFIGAILVASAAASGAWHLIRAREDLSEGRRAALGWIVVLSTYAVAVLAVIALIVTYMVISTRR
jgi:hypothetical protein